MLLGFQVESPDERGASCACLVHRALVDVLCLLFVHRDGSDEDDRHGGGQVFQLRLLNEPSLGVPASSLHEQSVDIGPFSRGTAEVFLVFLGHVALKTHLVQWPLVLASHGLHDSSEEGLRVEESSEPDAGRHVEISHPVLKVSDAKKEVDVPGGQPTQGGVGSFRP